MEHFKCLIIGSGPAGYTAAIYAGRANLAPVLYAGMQPGGQLTITTDIENFPGQPEPVNGFELMERMRLQAQRYGADIRSGNVTAVDFSRRPYTVTVDGTDSVEADTVIIATGASAKYLGLPDEQKYAGAGVSACATCDGFFYRKKTVAVVGGGDSACEEASYLSHLASKVYLVVRKPHLRASQIMQQRVTSAPNIEILYQHEVRGLYGEKFVEGARLVRHTPGGDIDVDLPIDGLFLAIGHHPNTEVFRPWLPTDEAGYLLTTPGTPRTKLPGIFAAGDVVLGAKTVVQAVRYAKEVARNMDEYVRSLEG